MMESSQFVDVTVPQVDGTEVIYEVRRGSKSSTEIAAEIALREAEIATIQTKSEE